MATLSEPIVSAASSSCLRPFDVRRDLLAVADLVEICFADTLDEGGRSYIRHMREASAQATFLHWMSTAAEWASVPLKGYVWEQDGYVVGNASVIPYTVKGQRFYLIANVAVHPDYRRLGIGRSLTVRCIEHARQRGVPSVWLHVREENAPAVRLYRSLGFLERARRTTWISQADYVKAERPEGVEFVRPTGQNWEMERAWLLRCYPPELSWHMPFNLNALHPGLWGAVFRFFNSAYVFQWGVARNKQLSGVAAWQSSPGSSNLLWLAAPPDADEELLHALLVYARRCQPTQRSLSLDYPARQFDRAIRAAGFNEQQTLIWMELPFER